MSDPKPTEPTEETPTWARSILENLTSLTGDMNNRLKALEDKNAPQPQPATQSSTGETENERDADDKPEPERKPKRKHWLLG